VQEPKLPIPDALEDAVAVAATLAEDTLVVTGGVAAEPVALDDVALPAATETMLPWLSTSGTAIKFVLMPKTALKAGK